MPGRAHTLQDSRGRSDEEWWSLLTPLRCSNKGVATQMSLASRPFTVAIITLLIVLLLYLTSLQNPVLSHSAAEMFGAVVALGIFMLRELRKAHARMEKALAEAKRVEDERQLTIDLLHLINTSYRDVDRSVESVTKRLTALLRERSGCEAVAIRYRKGSDYPYLVTSGLPGHFRQSENSLLASGAGRDDSGVPQELHHECLCGAVVSRGFDPSLPCFTPHGSFWTNSLSELFASSAEVRCLVTRRLCLAMRYESIALVPLRLGTETLGLVQFNDPRQGRFTPEFVAQLERIADHIAIAIGRLLTEEALRESEDRFRTVVEHSPEAKMIVWQGRIIFKNPEQERLFGAQPEEIPFRDVGAIHHEDERTFEQFCAAIGEESSRRQTLELRFYLPTPAGEKTLRWMHCQSNPIDYQGKKATLVSMVDITRVKDLERIVAIRENLASIGQLATGIAHEIRNPLCGVNLNLSTIEDLCLSSDGLGAQEKETVSLLLGQAKAASNRIASVVQHVMDFSRHAPPKLEMIDVNRVVEAAAEFSLAALRRSEVELQRALEPNEVKCLADFRLLEHVLLNLITNAVEAMQGGTGRKRLGLATAREDHRAVITVSDSGPGVPAHLHHRVFEPFYTTRKDGHGIGLSFSHRIIADHGGCLSVSTSQWGGAEFRIELPSERGAALA